MTVKEALDNALEFMESIGYTRGGDIHDDLRLAITRLRNKASKVMEEEL